MQSDERLAILRMIERGQVTAQQAADLLDALDASAVTETTLPEATVEEEAWMLTALLQVTEAISSPGTALDSLEDMIGRVVRIVPLLSGVDRCIVYLWRASGQDCTPIAWYPAQEALGLSCAERENLSRLYANGEAIIQNGQHATSRAFLPMAIQGKPLGVMQVEYVQKPHRFSLKETAILANIASQVAVGVENMRLRQEAVERARLERELQLARDVQRGLLPASAPDLPGWQIASHWQAARTVGGDFYDFVPLGGGRLGIVIADVSDKGMSAALFMALARSIIRASVARGGSLARAVQRANRLICADAHDGMFVTLFYGVIDADDNHMTYVNAGHNPPLLISGEQVTPLEGRGIALGVLGCAPGGETGNGTARRHRAHVYRRSDGGHQRAPGAIWARPTGTDRSLPSPAAG